MVKYEVRKGTCKPAELWSVVETDFGGNAENFVCEGTVTYCEATKERMEELDKENRKWKA